MFYDWLKLIFDPKLNKKSQLHIRMNASLQKSSVASLLLENRASGVKAWPHHTRRLDRHQDRQAREGVCFPHTFSVRNQQEQSGRGVGEEWVRSGWGVGERQEESWRKRAWESGHLSRWQKWAWEVGGRPKMGEKWVRTGLENGPGGFSSHYSNPRKLVWGFSLLRQAFDLFHALFLAVLTYHITNHIRCCELKNI